MEDTYKSYDVYKFPEIYVSDTEHELVIRVARF